MIFVWGLLGPFLNKINEREIILILTGKTADTTFHYIVHKNEKMKIHDAAANTT